MKRCYGCFAQIADDKTRCPVCGYVEGTSAGDPVFLVPGTLLSGRYIIGKVLENDDMTVSYIAWDNASSIKVKIKEYLPVKYVTRIPGSTFVVPFDQNRDALFDNGFKAFVKEANRLYEQGSDVKLYDCIGENNTAYMIFEWKDKRNDSPFKPAVKQPAYSQPVQAAAPAAAPVFTPTPPSAFTPAPEPAPAPAAKAAPASEPVSVPAPVPVQAPVSGPSPAFEPAPANVPPVVKGEPFKAAPVMENKVVQNSDNSGNGFARKVALLPLWLKVLVPVVLVALIAVPVIIAVVSSKSGKKTSGRQADSVTETTVETEETETEATETTPTSTTTETTLPPTGWQGNDYAGWRYYPEADVYYQDSWEEIGGEWYYFNSDGFMEKGCYRDGYWIGYDGIRAYESPSGEWKEDDEGSWYEDGGWYPSDMGLWIDGEYYWFDSDGYWDSSITSPDEVVRDTDDDEDDDEYDDEGDYGE